MKKERSAGGIIVRPYKKSWQVLLIVDMSNAWTFPKGKIEKGETRKDAAVREISEEVGLTGLEFIAPIQTVRYTYKRNGLVDKSVYYVLFGYPGRQKPVCQKEEGIKKAQWMSFEAARKRIGYPDTNTQLLDIAESILAQS